MAEILIATSSMQIHYFEMLFESMLATFPVHLARDGLLSPPRYRLQTTLISMARVHDPSSGLFCSALRVCALWSPICWRSVDLTIGTRRCTVQGCPFTVHKCRNGILSFRVDRQAEFLFKNHYHVDPLLDSPCPKWQTTPA